jgi:hypothetical protein
MHTPPVGGQPIPNTPYRRVVATDATDGQRNKGNDVARVLEIYMPGGSISSSTRSARSSLRDASRRRTTSTASTRNVDSPHAADGPSAYLPNRYSL